jgi:predicted HicB family RNase H-like nuclease
MKKSFRVFFEDENLELHTKVKSTAPLLQESMNEFIIKAIQERIEKIEKQKK